MSNIELRQFIAKYVQSAAYHEAGHVTGTALQGMPLRQGGIHVDSEGSGVSYYWHRSPGDPAMSTSDQLERQRTVIALYAGWISQTKFFPDPRCPQEAWASDRATICKLLKEMHPTDPVAQSAAQEIFRNKAEEIVSQNWSVIEGLALTLLAKPETPQPQTEIVAGWSQGKRKVERWMRGSEVAELLRKLGVSACVRPASDKGLDRQLGNGVPASLPCLN